MSAQCFSGHTDAVYAVAISPVVAQATKMTTTTTVAERTTEEEEGKKEGEEQLLEQAQEQEQEQDEPHALIRCLTGSGDDTAALWSFNVGTGELEDVQRLQGHTDSVSAVGFSPDGTLAATAGLDGQVLVWDAATGALTQTLEGPEEIEFLSWHNRANVVIAGGKDGLLWMWLAKTGQCMHVMAGHDGPITCGGFNATGKLIVTGSADASVRVWGAKNGQCRHVFSGHDGHEGAVTCIATHPSSGLILSGSEDGTVKVYTAPNFRMLGTMVHSTPTAVQPEDGGAGSAAAGRTEGSGSADAADQQGQEEGPQQQQREEEGEEDDEGEQLEGQDMMMPVECVGFSHTHENWCASGAMDGTVKVWDLTRFECRRVLAHEGGGGVVQLRWHKSFPVIYTSCTDGIVRLFDARTGDLLQHMSGHTNMVLSMAVSCRVWEGMDMLLTGSDDQTARVFVTEIPEQPVPTSTATTVAAAATAAAGTEDGDVGGADAEATGQAAAEDDGDP